ncbi:hypothetical protein CCUS01_08616 [Colletotrichum cuscutae]|uniref:Uncharacterized protein n=1 Tax=Colletotrichum cuscutae TaxID=1209917 RepID=A0AAI9URU1_9PEZI|nr:hypothetical protein CCUS01_08616 [Colletotrichum cuscutae]
MCGARHEYLTTPKTRLRRRDHIPVTWHCLAHQSCTTLTSTQFILSPRRNAEHSMRQCGSAVSLHSTTSFQDAPSYTNSNPANAKCLETEDGRLDSPDADS